MVAGGSLRAVEAILRGDVEHAFHPGGGLHHAMPDRASGFCIYDDPALAIARARRDGLRVLYVDLDVHHGDGVQAIHWADPGVLTLSFHETGRYLFPGTGEVGELGEGSAAGTSVNVPFQPGTGEGAWLAAVRSLLPELAAAFGPDLIVSQHGADSHAWDPLAHLRVTTTAMGEAARLVDAVAHRYAGGRWLATGGGGYDAYRVVPRSWSLVWLAGAHREVPDATPAAWRDRWSAEAARYGQAPLPERFVDAPNAGMLLDASQTAAETHSTETAALVRRLVVPAPAPRRAGSRLVGSARRRRQRPSAADPADGRRHRRRDVDRRRRSTRRTWARPDPGARRHRTGRSRPTAHRLVAAGLRDGLRATIAVAGTTVVGAALVAPSRRIGPPRRSARRRGRTRLAPARDRAGRSWPPTSRRGDLAATGMTAEVTVAERDPLEPLDVGLRRDIARRLLGGAGFDLRDATGPVRAADPFAISAVRPVAHAEPRR